MTDEQYIELIYKLRPSKSIVMTDRLLQMFKAEYPPDSLKLKALCEMVKMRDSQKEKRKG